MGHRKKQSFDWRSHRTANVARTPSRKWDLNSNKLTAGKEIQCGSILSSRLCKGGLRVADYFERAIVIKFQGNCCIDRILNVVKQLVHASAVCISKNKALRKFWRALEKLEVLSAAPQAALLCWPQIVYRVFLQEKVSKRKRGPALTIEKPSDCSYERRKSFLCRWKEDVSLRAEKSTFDVG